MQPMPTPVCMECTICVAHSLSLTLAYCCVARPASLCYVTNTIDRWCALLTNFDSSGRTAPTHTCFTIFTTTQHFSTKQICGVVAQTPRPSHDTRIDRHQLQKHTAQQTSTA
mmetsp:Transcript_33610/g.57640  ORF Transcript_33610/g.57640 Transcript_33610/m.57640 type:complete len:112 (-) Transcript_33610:458-793(-)